MGCCACPGLANGSGVCDLDTTAAFHSRENLWPGVYKLQVMLSDAQGQSCPADEVLTLHVCTCVDKRICGLGADRRAASSSQLSAAAIGLLLLATGLLLRETATHTLASTHCWAMLTRNGF